MRENDPKNGETSEIKPDVSDRAVHRSRNKQQKNAFFSGQPVKIAVGIAVLALLIFLIISGLNSTVPDPVDQPRDETSPITTQPENSAQDVGSVPDVVTDVEPLPISGTPTQAPVRPETLNQKRIEIPGEVTDALSAQQEQLTQLKETEMPGSAASAPQASNSNDISTSSLTRAQGIDQNKSTSSVAGTVTRARGSTEPGTITSLSAISASRFTLQVSSASQAETLVAFAKKNGMTDYWVYPTRRNDKPWFILITGDYASTADARAALQTMPSNVQANKPWVRSMQQVHQDLK